MLLLHATLLDSPGEVIQTLTGNYVASAPGLHQSLWLRSFRILKGVGRLFPLFGLHVVHVLRVKFLWRRSKPDISDVADLCPTSQDLGLRLRGSGLRLGLLTHQFGMSCRIVCSTTLATHPNKLERFSVGLLEFRPMHPAKF